MTTQEFIQKWRRTLNYLGLPTVGIHVGWELINPASKAQTLVGKKAWDSLQVSTPPWFKTPQTFAALMNSKNSDFQQIVNEETGNGKVEYYRNNKLREPYFCIFANADGSMSVLGDGNHRLFDCLYLIDHENIDFEADINNTTVDILYLDNFVEVLRTDLIWPNQ